MTQSDNGQRPLDQLPYYQEYVEQILRPRILTVLEDVRQRLHDRAWQDLLVQVAHDQGNASPDPEALSRLRAMLEASLGLQIDVNIQATLAGGTGGSENQARTGEPAERSNVEVIDRQFPDNPLAQAVGSVRRVNR